MRTAVAGIIRKCSLTGGVRKRGCKLGEGRPDILIFKLRDLTPTITITGAGIKTVKTDFTVVTHDVKLGNTSYPCDKQLTQEPLVCLRVL